MKNVLLQRVEAIHVGTILTRIPAQTGKPLGLNCVITVWSSFLELNAPTAILTRPLITSTIPIRSAVFTEYTSPAMF